MGTKNPLSPGSQFTGSGIVQGAALVSPKDGQPVAVIIDGAGVHRLAVDADLTADNITVNTRDLSYVTDSVTIGDKNNNSILLVNPDGSINVNTTLQASTDNVGISDQTTGYKLVVNSDGSINTDVTGTVAVSNFPSTVTVVQPTGSNLHVDIDNFPSVQPVSGTVAVTQSTTPWVENISQFGGSPVVTGVGPSGVGIPRVTLSNDSNIDNITGTISLPTGASTSALQTTGNTTLSSILANQTNGTQETQITNFPVTQPVSGTVTVDQGTIPWADNLTQVGGSAITLGQKVSAASIPVVIASDQSAITVVSSGTATVSGTVNTNLNGLNAFAATQYLVGTTPVQVTIPSGTSSIGLKAITTTSTDAVLVGPTGSVTNSLNGTGNGYPLFNGDSVQIDLTPTATLWVVGTSAGQVVGVLFAGG